MAYASLAELTAEFRKVTFNSTTIVTDTKANAILDQESERIDSALGQRYVVPITGAKSLKLIKAICLDLAVCRVERILQKDVTLSPPDTNKERQIINRCAKARQDLKDLASGKTTLDDAPLADASGAAAYNEDVSAFADFGDDKSEDKW